ncbi:MAG: transcriptional regulator, HxlR family [Myxococcales bacterium]|nr:transcriptional regulator, HxlR family [Myxococcales bacterium]
MTKSVRTKTKTKVKATKRPVMALLELLERRWALRVLWELRDGPLGFRALQARCGDPPPSSLSQRLGELTDGRILELAPEGYRYSREGAELVELLLPLNDWANRWRKRS